MYIQLDHNLVPGEIKDINMKVDLPGRQKEERKSGREGFGQPNRFLMKKYEVQKRDMKEILASRDKELEHIDHNFGFFSAILACYNNHWVLRTSPDDWWNVIVRNVAQAIDDNGKKDAVRDFFVAHQGKKEIAVDVGPTLSNIVGAEGWLFKKFTKGIKENIKTPGYADAMQVSRPDNMSTHISPGRLQHDDPRAADQQPGDADGLAAGVLRIHYVHLLRHPRGRDGRHRAGLGAAGGEDAEAAGPAAAGDGGGRAGRLVHQEPRHPGEAAGHPAGEA